jgi:hypothetical protein
MLGEQVDENERDRLARVLLQVPNTYLLDSTIASHRLARHHAELMLPEIQNAFEDGHFHGARAQSHERT